MLSCINISQLTHTPRALYQRRFPIAMIKPVLKNDTGELMQYLRLMKNSKYCPLYRNSYAKALIRLAQGMPGLTEGTNRIFFIPKKEVPADQWCNVTYGRIVMNFRPKKRICIAHTS